MYVNKLYFYGEFYKNKLDFRFLNSDYSNSISTKTRSLKRQQNRGFLFFWLIANFTLKTSLLLLVLFLIWVVCKTKGISCNMYYTYIIMRIFSLPNHFSKIIHMTWHLLLTLMKIVNVLFKWNCLDSERKMHRGR